MSHKQRKQLMDKLVERALKELESETADYETTQSYLSIIIALNVSYGRFMTQKKKRKMKDALIKPFCESLEKKPDSASFPGRMPNDVRFEKRYRDLLATIIKTIV